MVGELATCSSLFKITVVTKIINFVSLFQPRTEMRGEFLEILQDRLQGDTFQLHTETVPHTPHKGEQITSFVFRSNHRLVKLFVDLRSIMRICSQAPYGSTVVGQTN